MSPIPLAFSSGSALEVAFDDVSLFPFGPQDAEDRVILGCISKPFGLSLLVLGNYSPRRGPWALMESGPGPQILWPHTMFTLHYLIMKFLGHVIYMMADLNDFFFFFF